MKISDAIHALTGDTTCVVIKNNEIKASTERGIKPLIVLLEEDSDALRSSLIADKIIGRAAAFLAIYGGAAEVYGEVMTNEAMALLEECGIKASRKIEAEHIINRRGDGICPMEAATAEVSEADVAYKILREKVLG